MNRCFQIILQTYISGYVSWLVQYKSVTQLKIELYSSLLSQVQLLIFFSPSDADIFNLVPSVIKCNTVTYLLGFAVFSFFS